MLKLYIGVLGIALPRQSPLDCLSAGLEKAICPSLLFQANCWNCGRQASETCSGCNAARYCSQFCQHKDWESHHKVCAVAKKVASSVATSTASAATAALAAAGAGAAVTKKRDEAGDEGDDEDEVCCIIYYAYY